MEDKIEYLGEPIKTTFMLHSVKGYEDNRDVLYFSITGSPSNFVVFDVNKKKIVRMLPHKSEQPVKACWTHLNDKKGNVYMADFGYPAKLFRYSSKTKELKEVAALKNSIAAYHLCLDDKENICMGTAFDGCLVRYNPKRDEIIDYDNVLPNERYIMSLGYCNGYFYCGTRKEEPKFIRYDIENKKSEVLSIPDFLSDNPDVIYYITVIDKFVFTVFKLYNGEYVLCCYDSEKEKWTRVNESSLGGQHMSEPLNGITYFVNADGILKGINLETLDVEDTGITYYKLPVGDDGFDYANGIMGGGFYKLSDQEKYPGYTYITPNYDKNTLAYINLQNKSVEFIDCNTLYKDAIQIKAMAKTPGGNIIMGGYMGTKGIYYDIDKNEYKEFFLRQTEGIANCGEKTYFGVYTRAGIWEFDENKPIQNNVNPKCLLTIENGQDRPFSLIEHNGNLIVGSIPDYHLLNGALSVYNPDKKELKVYDNIIKNQSITGLCSYKNVIIGSTTIFGGLSTTPVEKTAKLFVFDTGCGRVIKEKNLDLPFNNIYHIGGLKKDKYGGIWGICSGVLFKLNPDDLSVEKFLDIYGVNLKYDTHIWKPFNIEFSGDYIYCNPDDMLTRVDMNTLEYHKYNKEAFMLCKGKDENIYFCDNTKFYRLKI